MFFLCMPTNFNDIAGECPLHAHTLAQGWGWDNAMTVFTCHSQPGCGECHNLHSSILAKEQENVMILCLLTPNRDVRITAISHALCPQQGNRTVPQLLILVHSGETVEGCHACVSRKRGRDEIHQHLHLWRRPQPALAPPADAPRPANKSNSHMVRHFSNW